MSHAAAPLPLESQAWVAQAFEQSMSHGPPGLVQGAGPAMAAVSLALAPVESSAPALAPAAVAPLGMPQAASVSSQPAASSEDSCCRGSTVPCFWPGTEGTLEAAGFTDHGGLSRDLQDGLLFDEVTSDIVLCVHDARLSAHRALLAARSPVFRAMLFGEMRERTLQEVQVNVFSVATMQLLLRFLYTGAAEDVRLEEMVPLMACADHYQVISLRDRISAHLSDCICAESACTVLALARSYQQEGLIERYLSFILTHAQKVMQTEAFLNLDATMLLKLIESDEARADEIDIFKALIRWHRQWSRDSLDNSGLADPAEDTIGAATGARGEPSGSIVQQQLFAAVRYGQMTGDQLVSEVRPFAGSIVPYDLYVWALEQVASPGFAIDAAKQLLLEREAAAATSATVLKQRRRRQPPVGTISISDHSLLVLNSTSVSKVGPPGWNCTVIIEPSTARTRFSLQHINDRQNGVGLAVFEPEFCGGRGGFPNPSQWGADCVAGLYGTGCFFGIITDHVLRWKAGLVLEVTIKAGTAGNLHISFCAEGAGADNESIVAEGVLGVTNSVRLAVALYSPEDTISIESVW